MKNLSSFLSLAGLAIACGTPSPTAPQGPVTEVSALPRSADAPSEEVVIEQVGAAAKVRDLEALIGLRPSATAYAKARGELALAIYWVGGVVAAKDDLLAVCHDVRLDERSRERSGACARLAFSEMSSGKPLNQLISGGEGAFLANQKLLIAMVSVGGQPAEPFIVDTGAPTTVISRRYAERVRLPYRTDLAERGSDAAGNAVELHPAILSSLKWGAIEIREVPAFVLELPENFKVGGILSPQDALRGTAFEIDGGGRVLRADPPPRTFGASGPRSDGPWEAPLLWNGGNLFVETRINDWPTLPFLLDTGAGGNGVCEEAQTRAGKVLAGGQRGASATAAGHSEVRMGVEGSLRVGDEPSRPTSLFVQSCPSDGAGPFEKSGYVGAPWFWARRVTFPADRRSVIFTDAAPSSE